MIVSPSRAERDRFTEGLIDNRASAAVARQGPRPVPGGSRRRRLPSAQRRSSTPPCMKRLEENETVVLTAEGLGADERERYVRMAAGFKRPRHLILLDTSARERSGRAIAPRSTISAAASTQASLGPRALRRRCDSAGESLTEIKRIVFQRPPRDD